MQGKILIVDAIATNRIVLKVKLASAFYEVLQASSLVEAAKLAREHAPDLVISALSLPDGDAAALCTQLKAFPLTAQVPILAIGAKPHADSRMATLEAGVHDVLLKPVDDTLLLGRVRNLIRAHNAVAEWQMRDDTSRALGLAEPPTQFGPVGRVVMVCTDATRGHSWVTRLRSQIRCELSLSDPADALRATLSQSTPDLFVLTLPSDPVEAIDTLRLIPAIRANARTRHAGLLVLQTRPDASLSANALDLGADDLMTDGFEAEEMALRLKALLRRKRIGDQMRATVQSGLKAAVFDPLTGLHNRRYAMPHLARIAEHALSTGRSFAVMLADMDHFKQVNDLYGHASGDSVLVDAAQRLRSTVRARDLIARIGGEEFLIVMPGTSLIEARQAARRLCHKIAGTPFSIPGHTRPIDVTVSIGLYVAEMKERSATQSLGTAEALLDQADKALYAAKMDGRNRVTLARPAA